MLSLDDDKGKFIDNVNEVVGLSYIDLFILCHAFISWILQYFSVQNSLWKCETVKGMEECKVDIINELKLTLESIM